MNKKTKFDLMQKAIDDFSFHYLTMTHHNPEWAIELNKILREDLIKKYLI